MITIPSGNLDDWLAELKPYQQRTLREFLNSATPEEAAERWIGATGSKNIVPFGGILDEKPFWEKFNGEFRKFLCDDDAYIAEKKMLHDESSVSKALLISTISASIGATIGFAATILAPAITLLLFSVAKMGLNAYCRKD